MCSMIQSLQKSVQHAVHNNKNFIKLALILTALNTYINS